MESRVMAPKVTNIYDFFLKTIVNLAGRAPQYATQIVATG